MAEHGTNGLTTTSILGTRYITHPKRKIQLSESRIYSRKAESMDKSWIYRIRRKYYQTTASRDGREMKAIIINPTVDHNTDSNVVTELIELSTHE